MLIVLEIIKSLIPQNGFYKILQPRNATEYLIEKCIKTFVNWEICDRISTRRNAKSEMHLQKFLKGQKGNPN